MAGLVSKFFRVTAGNLEDPDDLFVSVMWGLPRAGTVIQETRNGFLQAGRVFLGNLLQEGKVLKETASPFTDGILPKANLF